VESAEEVSHDTPSLVGIGEKRNHAHAQRIGQAQQFAIGHPPNLRFNFSKGFPAQIPSEQIAFSGKHWLG